MSNMEKATKLITQRKALRDSVLRQGDELEKSIIQKDIEEIELIYELLQKREKSISALDDEIAELIDVNLLEKEQKEVLEFQERLIRLRRRANKQIPVPAPINPQGSPNKPTPVEVRRARLPELRLKPFDGKHEEYHTFWDSFQSAIGGRSDVNDVDKLSYLFLYLKGDAERAVKGLTLTEENYKNASDILEERYGSKDVLINTIMSKLVKLKPIPDEFQFSALRYLCDEIDVGIRQLTSAGVAIATYGPVLMPLLMSKLPSRVLLMWNRRRHHLESKDNLDELLDFIKAELRDIEYTFQLKKDFAPSKPFSKKMPNDKRQYEGKEKDLMTMMYTDVSETNMSNSNEPSGKEPNGKDKKCIFCEEDHYSFRCKKVLEMSLKDREAAVKASHSCFNCLRGGHKSCDCNTRVTCRNCNRRHNTLLCRKSEESNPKDNKDNRERVKSFHLNSEPIGATILMTLQARAVDQDGNTMDVRLFLDPGSDKSFVCERINQSLNLKEIGSKDVVIEGFNGTVVSDGQLQITEVMLQPREETSDAINLKVSAMVVPNICHPLKKIPPGPWIKELEDKKIQLGESVQSYPGETATIDLLIGGDYYPQLVKEKVLRLTSGPMAISTHLGWTLLGPTVQVTNDKSVMMFLNSNPSDEDDENMYQCVKRFWSIEEMGVAESEAYTPSNKSSKIMKEFEGSISQLKDDHYQVALPKVQAGKMVQNNKWLAEQRLKYLKTKLDRSPEMLQRYHSEIRVLLDENIASPVNDSRDESGSFYIPHRAVVREDKETSKVRIVFDGSAKDSKGVSLNDCLEQGLNLNPELLQLLLRFRLHNIALVGDLRKAFLQIWINPDDRKLCKFLWFHDPENDEEPTTYQMNRVLFGLNCSPFLLSATLQYHCRKFLSQYPSTAGSLLTDMYVDDWVTGAENEEEAFLKYKEGKQIMSQGGFTLSKWKSSSKQLQFRILQDSQEPTGDRNTESTFGWDSTKVLGVKWLAETDSLVFDLTSLVEKMEEKSLVTKRQVLSIGSQIFDPMGLISPITVRFKRFLQIIWKANIKWDEPLPEYMQDHWSKFTSELKAHPKLTVPRSVNLRMSGELQIHVFTDASKTVYSAMAYVRIKFKDEISCQLLFTKARVAPVKELSIPRLELLGALLGARMNKYIKDASPILRRATSWFWTDSQVVVYWVNQPSKTWKTFVQNRVAEMQSICEEATWRWCPGKENPADIPTRGTSLEILQNSQTWQHGPEWLMEEESTWPRLEVQETEEVVQEKKKEKVKTHVTICSVMEEDRSADYYKIVRSIAWAFRWVQIVRNKRIKAEDRNGFELIKGTITQQEIEKAEMYWWKQIQSEQFSKELDALDKSKADWKRSINSLDPVVGSDGLIRVKGRLGKSDLPDELKHSIIVRGSHWVVQSYIRKCHEIAFHSGVSDTLVLVRRKLWVIQGRNEVKKIIRRCVTCQKQNKETMKQLMAPLPVNRVKEADVFDIVGIDFFGPYLVKPGRDNKAYGLIITCSVTRAIHLELLHSMETQEFLKALDRFAARRGVPKIIYSDNAKTFKKASRELTPNPQALFNDQELYGLLATRGIQWRFIVERAPWWGGMWERLIRSVKSLLKKHLGHAFLFFDELSTALIQIEGILNSRPLTFVYSDPGEPEPLSPNDILIGKKSTLMASVYDVKEPDDPEATIQRRLQRKNLIVKNFFKRWREEYLAELRKTYNHLKKVNEETKIQVGDICLIVDDFVPRQAWRLGRITKTHEGIDGLTRAVSLQTKRGDIKRPIQKLVKLEMELSNSIPGNKTPDLPPHGVSQSDDEKGGEDVPIQNSPQSVPLAEGAAIPLSNTNVYTRKGRKVKRPKHLKDYVE